MVHPILTGNFWLSRLKFQPAVEFPTSENWRCLTKSCLQNPKSPLCVSTQVTAVVIYCFFLALQSYLCWYVQYGIVIDQHWLMTTNCTDETFDLLRWSTSRNRRRRQSRKPVNNDTEVWLCLCRSFERQWNPENVVLFIPTMIYLVLITGIYQSYCQSKTLEFPFYSNHHWSSHGW